MALPTFKSLELQFQNYIDNPFSGRSVAPPTREILEFAYEQVQSLEEIARKMVLSSTSRFDLEIRVAVSKLLHKMYSLKDMHPKYSTMQIEFPMDQLEDLKRETLSFAEMLNNMAAEAEFPVAGEDENAAAVSSRINTSADELKMVGLSDQYGGLKHELTRPSGKIVPFVLVLVGMPGIGKTTLARKIFQDPDIVAHYDCRVWVTVGRKCQMKEIPRRILAAVDPSSSDEIFDDEDLAQRLGESLESKRYLIVLDDVWNKYMACQFLSHSECNLFKQNRFPEGRVLITTRLQQVEEYDGHFPDYVLKMRLLDKEESWDLLREKVFGEDQSCLPQLEKDGQKIAENCEGLPLTIVTVADLLSQEEKTPHYWRAVAAKKNHKIFMDAYSKISKVLYSSYEELTHLLRMCFLYMGVFPQNFEIPRSKLINMWTADGFLEPDAHTFQNPSALECLDELVSNSLVMIYQSSSVIDPRVVGTHQIKRCGLHSSLWHLSRREAEKSKFCHVLNVLDDCSDDYLEGQSRLSFHNNVLFGLKDVNLAVEGKCISSAHSLLCYGPYHQFQVPICFGLELLRELDALTIRFYEFPEKVLKLVQLKYLALTLNGKLPASISKLSKLQFLIVGRHMRIKSYRGSSYLPKEIWDMKELKHLQIMGSDLPDPHGSLENLTTVLNVSGQSCTEGVLKAIPNLGKLGIRVELVPNDGGKPLSCLDHIYHLEKLASLKCVIVNPESVLPPPLPTFPSHLRKLRKLSLSGLGCSWEEMSKIASLLFLEVLKLRNYAFRGPKWEVKEKIFNHLKSLVIEDTDLEEWIIGSESLKFLQSLRIKHCYRLVKIRWESDRPRIIRHWACHNSLKKIELVDCNPTGIEQMKEALPHWKKDALDVHSSWKDKKVKT